MPASRLDLTLDALDLRAFAEALRSFQSLFRKWNDAINLSAARTDRDVEDHLIDCLHVIPHLRAAQAEALAAAPDHASAQVRILDVGSGGGLPAVVVAICLPDAAVTALEPVHKKHAFLRTAARELGLANFAPLAQRLDDHAPADYDAVLSRATFDLRDWLLVGVTRVRPGGVVLGFEATERDDLPSGAQRHRYALERKTRAIIQLQRPA